MRLYALKNREGDVRLIAPNHIRVWKGVEEAKAFLKNSLPEKLDYAPNFDVVEVIGVPTEPCWFCKDQWRLKTNWNLCPLCGRSLRGATA